MSATHETFAELAAGYALGVLEGADLARFQQHLAAGCEDCTQALRDYHEALARVAGDLREAPPARVRHTLLARVAPAPRAGRPALRLAAAMALAASLAVWMTSALMRASYGPRLEAMAREADTLRAQLAEQGRTLVGLREQLAEQERTLTLVKVESAQQGRTLALLQDPTTRVVALGGLAPSPAAQGRMFWNPRAGGVFVAVDLPPAPEGKVYELWAIAGGRPVPAGLFGVDAQGRGRLEVAALEGVGQVDVFAVTLEPAGGVPAPTGQMYLASKAA